MKKRKVGKNIKNNVPKPGDKIVVWFSCGAASAVAAKKTIEKYGSICSIYIVNSGIKEEDEDNRRFLSDIEKWLGYPIEIAINPKYPMCSAKEIWAERRYMSGVAGAPCTKVLKKEVRYIWTENNKPDWHVLGFTSDEKKRHRLFVASEISNVLPILIKEKINKGRCFEIIQEAGIELPSIYKQGYPNANCKGCVKASSPTYWNHVRKVDPEIFKDRAEQSRDIGCRLVNHKGKRLFLDELPEDAKGRSMKNMSFECGVFCEITN